MQLSTANESVLSIWGKSTAVRIPTALAKTAGLKAGQKVRFEAAADGSIVMRPVVARPNLEALLARVTDENMPDAADLDWGAPRGTEAW
jgi:antitoxin component of MazEF toxin-antitoxin module